MKILSLILILCFTTVTQAQTQTKYIVVDQFGYRPNSEKIAVIRNPISGIDASESFSPSSSYALVNAIDNTQVFTENIIEWNSGNEDPSSGDSAWWFNFSAYEIPGTYYVLDINNNLKSFNFNIAENIYEDVLKHAMRTFFYQRAGYAKEAPFAENNWVDGASHVGNLQDTQCRRYNAPNDANTEKDLSGGWYDAGDYNKYTTWAANYIVDLLKAYKENPAAWLDNYNLPYSGNGIPDIIDEIKWGTDYLLRLQENNGSMISIVGLADASPPSAATEQSLYGAVNTSSTLSSTVAFAYGSKIFQELGMTDYASTLQQAALNAWSWADANPNVIWGNNTPEYNSEGIGTGQQETDDYGRFTYKIKAAIHLFDLTGNLSYKTFVESNYEDLHLLQWTYAYPFEQENQDALLYYAALSGANETVSTTIKTAYENAMNASYNFGGLYNESDPYLANMVDYGWGSNGIKSRKGLMFSNYIYYNINSSNNEDALRAAERYIHYIHGTNPLNFCYLSNMYNYGADNGVNEFYHAWFADGTPWDNVQNDAYGPAPGFLVGGPNPFYNWESCCPSGCGFLTDNCDATQVAAINNQPNQKAYDDFNTNWPMNSWEVTENSNSYQTAYVRLLSKFVGLNNALSTEDIDKKLLEVQLYPNPFKNQFTVTSKKTFSYRLFDVTGRAIKSGSCKTNSCLIGENIKNSGIYFIKINTDKASKTYKIIKE